MNTAQVAAYWADKPIKKWVVTLKGYRQGKPATDTMYVAASTGDRAHRAAKKNCIHLDKITRITSRLASPTDLGATETQKPMPG